MHFGQLTDVEQRVLGCLIEKRWTTPDQYPLSLNAQRLACNQATNRDPVTHYDESEVRDAAQRLSRYGLARLASGAGSRATKYRHLAEEGLGLDRDQLALLCVLLLRGPQTPGELKGRSERMAHLESLADVERVLGELADKGYAERLGRRPGQKEDRFRQLLGGEASPDAPIAAGGFDEPVASHRYQEPPRTYDEPPRTYDELPRTYEEPARSYDELPRTYEEPARSYDEAAEVAPPPAAAANGTLEARVAALEAELAALRAEQADLRARLADLLD